MQLKNMFLIKLDWESIRLCRHFYNNEKTFQSWKQKRCWVYWILLSVPLFVIKTEILTLSMWNAVEKKLLLIELEWESILEVVYIKKTTNNT